MALRKDGRMAVLVGDIRMQGRFYSIQHDMMRMGDFESFLVKGQFNCVSDSRRYQKPFIPIVTEYLLLLHKKDALMVPFLFAKERCFSIANTDLAALTWHHLIRMTMESAGGEMTLTQLYIRLEKPSKVKEKRTLQRAHPGNPVTYLYQGNLIRTSTVQAILEASSSHVRFETKNSIYTICYNDPPGTELQVIA